MIQQEISIRKQPDIKILLSNSSFKIHNKRFPEESVEYSYKDIQSLKIDKNINWTSTIISYLFLIFGATASKTFKSKNLIIRTHNGTEKISLEGCDIGKVEQALKIVGEKLN